MTECNIKDRKGVCVMSYSIIFGTKIVNLSDGRVLHFFRSGCNNDDVGRKRDEWFAAIYTQQELKNRIEGLKKGSKPYKENGNFELKIYGRPAAYYDYAKHIERAQKRAKSYKDFISEQRIFVSKYDRVDRNRFSATRLDLTNENNLIREIENGSLLRIYI